MQHKGSYRMAIGCLRVVQPICVISRTGAAEFTVSQVHDPSHTINHHLAVFFLTIASLRKVIIPKVNFILAKYAPILSHIRNFLHDPHVSSCHAPTHMRAMTAAKTSLATICVSPRLLIYSLPKTRHVEMGKNLWLCLQSDQVSVSRNIGNGASAAPFYLSMTYTRKTHLYKMVVLATYIQSPVSVLTTPIRGRDSKLATRRRGRGRLLADTKICRRWSLFCGKLNQSKYMESWSPCLPPRIFGLESKLNSFSDLVNAAGSLKTSRLQ